MSFKTIIIITGGLVLSACGSDDSIVSLSSSNASNNLSSTLQSSNELVSLLQASSPNGALNYFKLPDSSDYNSIPQDTYNILNEHKVNLGKFLYHETGLTQEGNTGRKGTWSCASCHQAKAGFKSGNSQGIGDGGDGYGFNGELRAVATEVNPNAVDVQPIASPTILNVAFQEVMLWNGQFGNARGSVNANVEPDKLFTEGTPKEVNARGFSGVEIQAIAGSGVHRMFMGEGSLLTENDEYIQMVEAVRDQSIDFAELPLEDIAALSIAAFERTVIANQSPFQKYLRGNTMAMNQKGVEGAKLFFGKAGCSSCHTGPALSSPIDATPDQIFFAIGFADLDMYNSIQGEVDEATRKGRGGFTGKKDDDYKFKIPPLYNIADAGFLGHGNSFNSVREVVEYKNKAIPEVYNENIDPRFVPLNLSEREVDNLVSFIEEGLRDSNLERYEPLELPSGQCRINNDYNSRVDLDC
jgi:cytochrome c peroxidase